jgi:hypothetical protein
LEGGLAGVTGITGAAAEGVAGVGAGGAAAGAALAGCVADAGCSGAAGVMEALIDLVRKIARRRKQTNKMTVTRVATSPVLAPNADWALPPAPPKAPLNPPPLGFWINTTSVISSETQTNSVAMVVMSHTPTTGTKNERGIDFLFQFPKKINHRDTEDTERNF